MNRPLTLAQALAQAQDAGLTRLDAQMLLLHLLERAPHERAWLIAHDDAPFPAALHARWSELIAQRLAGVPVAYLTGRKAFYGLELQVDARVLDPRDDTETLVDWALTVLPDTDLHSKPNKPFGLSTSTSSVHGLSKPGYRASTGSARTGVMKANGYESAAVHVLDLGAGSGAIALAIAHERPAAHITATDASPDALAVAHANGQRLNLPVRWLQGAWDDWFAPLAPDARFDLIVSNPPYVAEGDPHLAALAHEPPTALTSGPDGLNDIRRIVAGAGAHLAPGGWLLLEHGHDQASAVRALLTQAGFAQVQSRRDLAGIERCSGGVWAEA